MPCWLETASAWADIVAAVVAVFGVPILLWQVYQQGQEMRKAVQGRLAMLIQDRRPRDAVAYVLGGEADKLHYDSMSRKERRRANLVVNYLRDVAFELERGLVPDGEVYRQLGEEIFEDTRRLDPYMKQRQQIHGRPEIDREVFKMVERLHQYGREHGEE